MKYLLQVVIKGCSPLAHFVIQSFLQVSWNGMQTLILLGMNLKETRNWLCKFLCYHRVLWLWPLYFQHDGHSRTIVGIQMQKAKSSSARSYSLLILDPAHRTAALKGSLNSNNGWQRMIKRGAHTLTKSQYQLCYVDLGIAAVGEEMEQLKYIDSILVEL